MVAFVASQNAQHVHLRRKLIGYLQRRQASNDAKFKPVQRIDIDEIALEKKHRQYACVIVDHDNQRVLEVLENREKTTGTNAVTGHGPRSDRVIPSVPQEHDICTHSGVGSPSRSPRSAWH